MANTSEAEPEFEVQIPVLKSRPRTSPAKSAPPFASASSPLLAAPEAQISARPDRPSTMRVVQRPRNIAKPDPAQGQKYDLNRDGQLVGDIREVSGYLHQYEDLYDDLNEMQERILELATDHFRDNIPTGGMANYLQTLDGRMTPELQRYVGYLAVGGPCGLAGWEEIFLDSQLRIALVAGVIWRALKQHVFEALWFGADAAINAQLEENEVQLKGQDDGKSKPRPRPS